MPSLSCYRETNNVDSSWRTGAGSAPDGRLVPSLLLIQKQIMPEAKFSFCENVHTPMAFTPISIDTSSRIPSPTTKGLRHL